MEFKTIEAAIEQVFGDAALVHETEVFNGQTFKPALAVCAHPKVLATVRHFCETRFERSLSKNQTVRTGRFRCSEFFIF
jgi:hypothetical protein